MTRTIELSVLNIDFDTNKEARYVKQRSRRLGKNIINVLNESFSKSMVDALLYPYIESTDSLGIKREKIGLLWLLCTALDNNKKLDNKVVRR